MAGLRDLKARIEAVETIKTVTEAMSNIANAKFTGAYARLLHARAFTSDLEKVVFSIVEETEDIPQNPRFHVFGSDAGLCGSVNTLLCKYVSTQHLEYAESKTAPTYFVSGAKIGPRISKTPGVQIDMAVQNLYKKLNSTQIASIADQLSKEPESDQNLFMYQGMITANKFKIQTETMPTKAQIGAYHGEVEIDGDYDVVTNLTEYLTYLNLWRCHVEQEASELNARSSSMQNAANAAGDMIDDLGLTYRKVRQAKVTTEIIEISTGASAVMTD